MELQKVQGADMDANTSPFFHRSVLYGGELSQNTPPALDSKDPLRFSGEHYGAGSSFSVSDEILGRHILITGGTGTGKTNLFFHCTKQLKAHMTPDDVMIIFDTKGDYYREFYDTARDSVIGCSSEYRSISAKWNIFREILMDGYDDEAVIMNTLEICRAVFAESMQRTQDIFFPNAARELMAALIINPIRARKSGLLSPDKLNNANLRRVINENDADGLSDILRDYEDTAARAQYIAGGSEQAQGVLSELYTVTGSLLINVFGSEGKFSVRNFVRKRGGRTLFIEYDLAVGDTLAPVYSILMDLALKETLSRSSSDTPGNVYIILDELKLLPYLRHLENGINFGRSMGLRIIAGLQSIDQLHSVYKDNTAAADNIISGFSSVIAFRPSDSATRSYISKLHGRKIILEQYEQLNGQLKDIRSDGNIVEDWDILNLVRGEAVIGLAGTAPFTFKFRRYS